jgi:sugar phosphate isomerase/epimerase
MPIHRILIPLLTSVGCLLALTPALRAEAIPPSHKINGFAVGAQAYSFNRFSVFEAIEKTAEAGGKVIEFYPGQRLTREEPNLRWNHGAGEDVITRVEEKLKKHGIKAVNYGVVSGKDQWEWENIFKFADRLKLYAITTEDATKLNIIEPLVKKYDIRVAIHNHPRKPNDPGYKVWDPHYILEVTKGRDERIGACADTGHWQTSGLDPLFCVKLLKGRVISSHMKDKTEFGTGQHDVPYGTGVGRLGLVLDELKKQGFEGNISVEYEYNWDNSVPDIKKCVDFVRQHGAAK